MELKDFTQVSPYRWVLEKDKSKSSQVKMNVNAEIFATENILNSAIADQALQQVINVSSLPGILSISIC